MIQHPDFAVALVANSITQDHPTLRVWRRGLSPRHRCRLPPSEPWHDDLWHHSPYRGALLVSAENTVAAIRETFTALFGASDPHEVERSIEAAYLALATTLEQHPTRLSCRLLHEHTNQHPHRLRVDFPHSGKV